MLVPKVSVGTSNKTGLDSRSRGNDRIGKDSINNCNVKLTMQKCPAPRHPKRKRGGALLIDNC